MLKSLFELWTDKLVSYVISLFINTKYLTRIASIQEFLKWKSSLVSFRKISHLNSTDQIKLTVFLFLRCLSWYAFCILCLETSRKNILKNYKKFRNVTESPSYICIHWNGWSKWISLKHWNHITFSWVEYILQAILSFLF